ncbi:aldehyde-activating protein [Oceanicola sp. 22II-s10i]|uniref:GFA family protein n=1 Tax=Oceanicola sp. 22II-s10i TaxID=1317116 RepID=UPI000B52366A|nr:GFA family protein [Oceanicola sp. 22II-s10i]OWU85530.1 aldehyde-activating protein [Oceanicola sp. 22II-s10i]
MLNGSCLCGACTFAVTGPVRSASVCHCTMCRKMTGHTWASAQAPETAVAISGPVAWFEASPKARRGFCPRCGSTLFWQGTGETAMSFSLGCIDGPTGIRLEKHIFTADKGDYYDIQDDLPRHP